MQPRLVHWVVLFFTRPVHWSDAKAVLGRLEPRGRRGAAVVATAMPDEPPARPARPAVQKQAARAAVAVPAFDYSAQDMAVSEQPLDSLPAELQMELASMTGGRAQDRSSHRVAAEPAGSSSE